MKRICAYMMAALLALSSVFCPAIPVLAEGEEIIDADGYGTMVEDVLTDRFSGMQPSQQENIYFEAEDPLEDALLDTLSSDEYQAFEEYLLQQQDYGTEKAVNVTNVADLPANSMITEDGGESVFLLSGIDDAVTAEASMPMMMASGFDEGIMTTAANTSVDGLSLSKKVIQNQDGSYSVQLEAYTTGTVTTTTKYVPADIVLVIDLSGSMIADGNKMDGQTRLTAMKTAVRKFITQVYNQATKNNVDHRVALVTFGSDDVFTRFYNGESIENVTGSGYAKTGAYQFNDNKDALIFNIYGVSDANCKKTLVSLKGSTTNRDLLLNAVGATDSVGMTTYSQVATFPDIGLELANKIFKNNAATNRNRVIVMFSDGGPGWNSRWFDVNAAQRAVAQANTAKNTYGATVYTVGVFGGADATTKGTNPGASFTPSSSYKVSNTYGQYGNNKQIGSTWYSYNDGYKNNVLKYDAILSGNYSAYCNWFLQNVSSNNGNIKNPSYYLSASSTTALNNIFETIANTVSKPTVSMETETVIRDYMSSYFKLPAGTDASKVVIKTAKYSAEGTFGKELDQNCGATAKIESDGSVSVTGFDFNHYFCSTTQKNTGDESYGRKLIIRFPIEPVEGFLGGNNVPTNDPTKSGIYASGSETTPIATFPAPSANVPLVLPDFAVTDKTVYYGTQVTPDELYTPFTPANDVADDFVKITYVKPAQTDISDEACTENLNYTLQIVAKSSAVDSSVGTKQPTTVTDAAKQQRTKQADVHVLIPEKTYNDTSIYLGQKADYTNNGADTAHTWIDQSGHTGYPTATGTAPEVVFTYNPAEGAFETDTPVNVTATIDGAEATNAVSFKWTDDCTANHGSWPKIETPHLGGMDKNNYDSPEFYVHILNNSLTITKSGLNQFVYTDGSDQESAIFTVTEQGGKGRTWTVPINGNGSVTLDGLYAGATYTVTEQNGWTWRYKDLAAHIMVLKPGTKNAFTFANELEENKWLGGDNYENNVFGN